MARAPRSSRAARRRAQDRLQCGNTHLVASREGCTWTGVRERVRGRWAAQIRIPGTCARLWIDRFEQAVQAALAYDAALFCFYGARDLPSARKFNFPTVPCPNISDDVRATLTLNNIKNIAESHARTMADFLIGMLPVGPAPPPAAATTDGVTNVAGEGAPATHDSCKGINSMG